MLFFFRWRSHDITTFKEPAKHWCGGELRSYNCGNCQKRRLFEPDLKPCVSVNTGSIHMKQKLTQRSMWLLLVYMNWVTIYEISMDYFLKILWKKWWQYLAMIWVKTLKANFKMEKFELIILWSNLKLSYASNILKNNYLPIWDCFKGVFFGQMSDF